MWCASLNNCQNFMWIRANIKFLWIGIFYAWMCEIKGDMGILLDCWRLYFGELKLAFSCEFNLQVEQTAFCIRTLRCKLINCLADSLWCFSHAAWGKMHSKNQKKLQDQHKMLYFLFQLHIFTQNKAINLVFISIGTLSIVSFEWNYQNLI